MKETIANPLQYNKTIVISIHKDTIWIFKKIENIYQKLYNLGLLQKNEPFSVAVHRISRFLFCPNNKIKKEINNLIHQLNNKKRIAYQLRMGGDLADTKEKVTFLTVKKLPQITTIINNITVSNCAIYVSTDSTFALDYIRNNTNKKIYYMNVFNRGYSSLKHNNKTVLSSLEGAIYDLGILSFSDELYYTQGSSYGLFASFLSTASIKAIE